MTIPHAAIRSALRRLWLFSPERHAAKARARVDVGWYHCESCGGLTQKVEVDHREAIGPTPGSRNADAETTWDRFITRLFEGELQAICGKCHNGKTKQQRESA